MKKALLYRRYNGRSNAVVSLSVRGAFPTNDRFEARVATSSNGVLCCFCREVADAGQVANGPC
jgi:hypothetical protein